MTWVFRAASAGTTSREPFERTNNCAPAAWSRSGYGRDEDLAEASRDPLAHDRGAQCSRSWHGIANAPGLRLAAGGLDAPASLRFIRRVTAASRHRRDSSLRVLHRAVQRPHVGDHVRCVLHGHPEPRHRRTKLIAVTVDGALCQQTQGLRVRVAGQPSVSRRTNGPIVGPRRPERNRSAHEAIGGDDLAAIVPSRVALGTVDHLLHQVPAVLHVAHRDGWRQGLPGRVRRRSTLWVLGGTRHGDPQDSLVLSANPDCRSWLSVFSSR